MSPLPVPSGDPAALDQAVDRYAHTQAAIERAADDLLAAMCDGQGLAMAALGETIGEAEDALTAAHGRYQGATLALRDYVVALATFHRAAHAAIDSEQQALRQLDWAEQEKADAGDRLRRATVDPARAEDLDSAHRDLWAAVASRDAAQDAVDAPRSDYRSAEAALDDAAQVAIARIVASFDGTNDGFMDHVENAFAAAGQVLTDLTRWATGFLAAVLDVVMAAVEAYLVALAFGIVLIALAVALVAVFALALAALVVVLALVVGALLSLLAVVLAGAAMYDLTERLGIEGLAQLRLVLGAACAVCPLLAVAIVTRVADEAGKPTPAVGPLRARDSQDAAALTELDAAIPSNAGDVLEWAGLVDRVGGDQRAVVDVAKVTRENGSVAWIVTLPSTQDWVVGGDKPAPNDLDADLVLELFPQIRTQYERAVLAAMAQAGIGQGDPVLLSGWSLGGIGGGRLIESRQGGYRYEGLVCAGSPVDHMAIPREVRVLQVKHTMDVVHRADLIDGLPDTARHVSLWDGPRSGGAARLHANPIAAHSNAAYVETLRAHTVVDDSTSVMFSDFYAIDDPATAAVPRVEHVQYEFGE
ncbi:MAG: hypothetical protein H5T82_03335 [Demequina sp.]|nr:hypothetical protein [Demequina sp.]